MEYWFVWLVRLMFLGLFLLAGGMFFRAWKIAVRKDFRYVADWRGKTLPDPGRWAPWVLVINFIAAGLLVAVGVSVLLWGLAFNVWTGTGAFVLWSYYFLLRVVSQRAAR